MADDPAAAHIDADEDVVEPPTTTEAIQTVQRVAWIRGISVLIGVSIVLVALGWVAGAISNRLAGTPDERALAQIELAEDGAAVAADAPVGVEATLYWSEELGTGVLVATGLPEPGRYDEFALWYISGEEEYTRVLGFTAPQGRASIVLPELWEPGQAVMVSIDPEGGSSVGEPEQDPLLTFDVPDAP
ncbi:anti-sigma factor [Microbacterium sp. No. 7]|uniref:anti-sigma factor n=1 Tax=Microbacterium sp. No. 7 TaxID=1714373 RepID=UPI0006CF931C|nr:anti-sigma factor [Microbacterium sp. No. 7]